MERGLLMPKALPDTEPQAPSHGSGTAVPATGKRRPKLVFFVPGLSLGGLERHTVFLRDHLRARGFDTSLMVYGPRRSEVVAQLPGAENPVSLDRRGMSDLPGWAVVWKALRAQSADVIFATNQTPAVVSALLRLVGATRAKVVCVFHTTLLSKPEEQRYALFKGAARLFDALVFVSINQQRYWEGRGLRSRRNLTIVNGVDTASYPSFAEDNTAAKRALGFAPDDYVLGLLATFRPEKNHTQLVEAAARLRQQGIPAKILFIGGEGETREATMSRVAELGLAEHVVLRLDVADVRPLVAAFDVGVICSTAIETFSVAALEQLAMGVPMIMSDIGGASEIVEDGTNGYLFEAGDTDGLVDCLMRLHDPERRQGMRRAARPSIERYTTARMIAAYEQLALELA